MAVNIPFPIPSHGYALNSKLAVNLQFIVDQFNTFNSGSASWDQVVIGTGNSITGKLSMFNSSNNNYIAFQPGVTGASVTYTLPITAPTQSSFLLSSGADVMSWSAVPTSSLIYGNSTPALTSLAIDGTANKILLTASSNTLAWSAITLNVNGASQGLLYTAAGVSIDPLTNSQGAEGFPAVPTSNIPVIKKMLGTSNQVVVTKNTNDWTLSTPQDIGTSSDVVFGTVKVGNGLVSNCAIKFNATNSGLYNSNTNEWSIAFGGVQKFQFNGDVAPFLGVQGDIAANNYVGYSLRLNGATSGDIVFAVPATITTHTLTLPSAHGGANTVLTDAAGNGTLSWASPGSITGTVNSGTAGRLSLYATSTSAVSDTYVQNTKNITLAIAAQGSRSADLALTIPNPGNAVTSANVVLDQGNYTISGTWTSPTFVTPVLGTPTSGALTNCTSIPVANATGTLAVGNGGTGQTTYTDGQLLIGNTTGNTLAKATLTGTTDQVVVTNGHGTITLSTPQSINTTSSPTFVRLTLGNGLVGTPSINFGDSATGIFRSGTNQIAVSLNGIRSLRSTTAGTADATNYTPLEWLGGGQVGGVTKQTTITVTTAAVIMAQTYDCALVLVSGNDGSGNEFFECVTFNGTSVSTAFGTCTVGSPAARTYSVSSTNLRVAMASGTYSISATSISTNKR